MTLKVVVIGDEGWTADELERRANQRAFDRARYRNDPARRAAVLERARRWNSDHLEERRTYHRDWMRRHRAELRAAARVLHAVASLHSLACSGPTRDTGCRCCKTVLWREERSA